MSSAQRSSPPASRNSEADVIAGRYEIVRPLGEGTSGTVFLARDLMLAGLPVALKLLAADRFASPDARIRLQRELLAGFGIEHPNVAKSYDIVRDDVLFGYTMEFMEGPTLATIIAEGRPRDPITIAIWVLQACRGLAAIHSSGLLHRDLKPANLMLSSHGECKIVDLGLVREREAAGQTPGLRLIELAAPLSDSPAATVAGSLLGTPLYIAPESVISGHYCRQSDLYSLGLVLYELLTGRLPFRELSAIGVMKEKTERNDSLIGVVDDPHRAVLFAIAEKATSRLPENRYASAEEMAAALTGALIHLSAAQLGPGPKVRVQQASKARIARTLAAALRTALTILLVAALWLGAFALVRKPGLAKAMFEEIEMLLTSVSGGVEASPPAA